MDIEQINILLNDRAQKAVKAYEQKKFVRHISTDLYGKISELEMSAPYEYNAPVNCTVVILLFGGGRITVNAADIEIDI